ncbi:MAG: NOG1 family protein [Methanocella sp.]
MIFEKIGTVPTADELMDKAFSRAVRAGRGKMSGAYADKKVVEESMVITAGNILSDNLHNATREWPSFDRIGPFYREIADILAGVDRIKMALSSVTWAADKSKDISRKYVSTIRKSDDPTKVRKQAFARMASIVHDVDRDLRFLNDTRNKLKDLPDIKDEPTIVVAGYPNVGKSSFVARVSSAKPEIALYPFTTKGVVIGHFTKKKLRYQVIDTPGLLDRPLDERNEIELQAISALRYVGDVLLFILDPSEECGFTMAEQEKLLDEVRHTVKIPVLVVANKIDMPHAEAHADMQMSTLTGEGVNAVKERLYEMMQQEAHPKQPVGEEEIKPEFELPPSRKKK